MFTKISIRYLSGKNQGQILTQEFNASSAYDAEQTILKMPVGSIHGGGFSGPEFEVISHDVIQDS
jgi:hypothetical protein